MFKWIKKKLEECDIRLARVDHKYYSDQINREVKHIQKNVGLSEAEIEQYKKIHQTCQAKNRTIDKYDVIIATIKSTYDVPIAGIYWLDGWFRSMRFDQDRYDSNLIEINPRFCNKIKHTWNIFEGDYIVVLQSDVRTLKTKIQDLKGRILRDQINCPEYYARLIKITKDYCKENEQAYGDYLRRINEIANKIVGPYPLDGFNKNIADKYKNIRDGLMSNHPYDNDNTWVEGTVIDRRFIKTVGDVSYMNFKQGKPKMVGVGDFAYMSSGNSFSPASKVEILEVRKNNFLVKEVHAGRIGEVDKLYDATGAYLTGYFQENETTATLKWGQDHKPKKYKIW